jgi:hypothetical protein
MYLEPESSESDVNIGPQRLIDSVMKTDYHRDIKEKHHLTERSKFMIALETLQEDYRPSETVSCRDREK